MSVGASTTAAHLAAVIVSQLDDPTTEHQKLIHSIRMGRNEGLPRGSVNLAARSGLGRLGMLSE